MDPADVVVSWADWSREERLGALSDVVNQTLEENGYDDVDTQDDDIGYSSNYNPDTNTVSFGDDMLDADDPMDALQSAYHETGHAMRDQDGSEPLSPDEYATWNEKSFDFVQDDEDPDGYATPSNANPMHDDVNAFADYMMDRTLGPSGGGGGGGGGSAAGGESAADADAPTSHDVSFEPDFDNATVTSEPSDDVSFDIDVANAVVSP
jgi:hypothetical protein